MVLSYRPTPLIERTDPEISIVLGFGQVSSQIEQIVDGSANTEKPLGLPC
jgi:hypothetical protein